jgi:hypothetical protein
MTHAGSLLPIRYQDTEGSRSRRSAKTLALVHLGPLTVGLETAASNSRESVARVLSRSPHSVLKRP